MKKLTFLMATIILQISFAYCQFDSSVTKTNKQVESNSYQLKAKKQKKAARICLGGGMLLATTGLIVGTAKAMEEFVYGFGVEDYKEKNYTGESILIIAGVATMAVSVPLFISSGKNKQKAKLKIAFQKGADGLPVALSKKIPGFTVSIPL